MPDRPRRINARLLSILLSSQVQPEVPQPQGRPPTYLAKSPLDSIPHRGAVMSTARSRALMLRSRSRVLGSSALSNHEKQGGRGEDASALRKPVQVFGPGLWRKLRVRGGVSSSIRWTDSSPTGLRECFGSFNLPPRPVPFRPPSPPLLLDPFSPLLEPPQAPLLKERDVQQLPSAG